MVARGRSDFENANALRNPAGHLYYARMKTKWGIFYKLGYTSRSSLEDRLNYGDKKGGDLVDRVLLWSWSDNAQQEEQRLHDMFHDKRVFGKYGRFHNGPLYKNGQSELYAEDILDLDPEFTNAQLTNSIKAVERIGIEYRNNPIGDHRIWNLVGAVLMVAFSPLILFRKILEQTVPAMKREKERNFELERKRESDIAAAILAIKKKSKPFPDRAGSQDSNKMFDSARPGDGWEQNLCNWLNRALAVEPEDMTAEDMFRTVKGNFNPRTINTVECLVLGDAQGGRNISELPESLYELRGLRSLHLQRNPIEYLSSRLGQLVNLEELKLGGTSLKTLPAAIGQLKKLRILTLWWSDLESLPPEIGNLSELEGFDVSSCENLKGLPKEVVKLRKIQRVYLPDHDDFRLTAVQHSWIEMLRSNGAEIEFF